MSVFTLPDLGEGLPEAEIREWLVNEGDHVTEDQPIVSMETAKAVVDVPSPTNGVITKLHGQPGDVIETGHALVSFAADENTSAAQEDAGTVVGEIKSSNTVLQEAAAGITRSSKSHARVKATPTTRRLAKQLQIDINTVPASGPSHSVTTADVQRFATSQGLSVDTQAESASVKPTASNKTQLKPSLNKDIPDQHTTLTGARRAMAMAMAKSHQEIVPVTLFEDADIHHFTKDTDVTLRVVRAIAAACAKEPALNAHFDGQTLSRRTFEEVNLALAVDTPTGLYTPVMQQVNKCDDKQLRQFIKEFKQSARDANFTPAQLKGGTITLSNFGVFTGKYANPIVVPPMVAILGTGKLRETVMPINGELKIHRIMPLSLTFDHRAVTGGEAARFLAALIEDLSRQ